MVVDPLTCSFDERGKVHALNAASACNWSVTAEQFRWVHRKLVEALTSLALPRHLLPVPDEVQARAHLRLIAHHSPE